MKFLKDFKESLKDFEILKEFLEKSFKESLKDFRPGGGEGLAPPCSRTERTQKVDRTHVGPNGVAWWYQTTNPVTCLDHGLDRMEQDRTQFLLPTQVVCTDEHQQGTE